MPGAAQALLGLAPGLRRPSTAPGCRLAARRARAPAPRICAFARGNSSTADHPGQHGRHTYERVLRYPNGTVRRIRYPPPPAEDPAAPPEDLTDGCWADSCWEPRAQWLGLAAAAAAGPPSCGAPSASGSSASASGAASSGRAAAAPAPPQQPAQAEPGERGGQPSGPSSPLPSSPMELLRYLNSPEYKASQEEFWRRVRGSYEVVDAVPWVAPRPLYLLATEQRSQPSASAAAAAAVRFGGGAAPGLTHSLRTRVERREAADELSLVLKKRAPDGSALISCSEMKDGVVAFEDEADAERYGQQLEAEGSAEVSVARCDSHELFRSVQDVQGVVVLFRRGGDYVPAPNHLATSLRQGGGASSDPLLE